MEAFFLEPAVGSFPEGDVVKVYGAGFADATGVTFDGLAAPNFFVVDDFEITVTTPAGSGAVDVVVQGTGDQAGPLTYRYPDPSSGGGGGGAVVEGTVMMFEPGTLLMVLDPVQVPPDIAMAKIPPAGEAPRTTPVRTEVEGLDDKLAEVDAVEIFRLYPDIDPTDWPGGEEASAIFSALARTVVVRLPEDANTDVALDRLLTGLPNPFEWGSPVPLVNLAQTAAPGTTRLALAEHLLTINARAAWHLLQLRPNRANPRDGVPIAIIDSGGGATDPRLAPAVAPSVGSTFSVLTATSAMRNPGTHGQRVAAFAAAEYGTIDALCGVALNSPLHLVQVLEASEEGTGFPITRAMAGIVHAAFRTSASVVNCSFAIAGGNWDDWPWQLPLLAAKSIAGCTIVAATGNEGLTISKTWPADSPHVIAVGGLEVDGLTLWPASNRGSRVDLCAPANNLKHSVLGINGTSYAAPQVAGAAALMLSQNTHLTPDDVSAILRLFATPTLSPASAVGAGCLNVGQAVEWVVEFGF